MLNVYFDSGFSEIDSVLDSTEQFSELFRSISARHASDTKATQTDTHPMIFPTRIDVTMFTDVDNTMSYAINTSREFDSGRIKLQEFVVKQVWTETDGHNRLELQDDNGNTLHHFDTPLTIALSAVADLYRLAHTYVAND